MSGIEATIEGPATELGPENALHSFTAALSGGDLQGAAGCLPAQVA
jgi:hypothetical protein